MGKSPARAAQPAAGALGLRPTQSKQKAGKIRADPRHPLRSEREAPVDVKLLLGLGDGAARKGAVHTSEAGRRNVGQKAIREAAGVQRPNARPGLTWSKHTAVVAWPKRATRALAAAGNHP